MKPVVDRLEEETKGRLNIIRLDIHNRIGRQIAADYGFQYTPTFVFLDAQGVEVWRSIGSLDIDLVLSSLKD